MACIGAYDMEHHVTCLCNFFFVSTHPPRTYPTLPPAHCPCTHIPCPPCMHPTLLPAHHPCMHAALNVPLPSHAHGTPHTPACLCALTLLHNCMHMNAVAPMLTCQPCPCPCTHGTVTLTTCPHPTGAPMCICHLHAHLHACLCTCTWPHYCMHTCAVLPMHTHQHMQGGWGDEGGVECQSGPVCSLPFFFPCFLFCSIFCDSYYVQL